MYSKYDNKYTSSTIYSVANSLQLGSVNYIDNKVLKPKQKKYKITSFVRETYKAVKKGKYGYLYSNEHINDINILAAKDSIELQINERFDADGYHYYIVFKKEVK